MCEIANEEEEEEDALEIYRQALQLVTDPDSAEHADSTGTQTHSNTHAASSASMQPLTLADAENAASSALGMSGGAEQTLGNSMQQEGNMETELAPVPVIHTIQMKSVTFEVPQDANIDAICRPPALI